MRKQRRKMKKEAMKKENRNKESGEIRPVNRCDQRIQEAEKLGFERIFVSKYNKIDRQDFSIKVVKVSKIEEVFKMLFAS